MDKSKTYNNTNSGVLWAIPKKKDGKPEFSLIQQGKLNIDGNEMRIVGISRFNKDGERMVGIYREIGTIKKNNLKSGEKTQMPKVLLTILLIMVDILFQLGRKNMAMVKKKITTLA